MDGDACIGLGRVAAARGEDMRAPSTAGTSTCGATATPVRALLQRQQPHVSALHASVSACCRLAWSWYQWYGIAKHS